MDGLLLKYFVLRPRGTDLHAAASRAAMRQYASVVADENPTLARDLTDWANRELDIAGDKS